MKTDRLDAFLDSLSKQRATPAERRLRELVPLGDDHIPRYQLVERLLDEGGSLRELSETRALKKGGLSVRFKGTVLVLGDGVNYWDPKEVTSAGMLYAQYLIEAEQVRPVPPGTKCIGRLR